MGTSTTSVDVDRPADAVFAYATDPTRFAEWQAGVIDGSMDDPTDERVGSRFRTT